MYQGYLYYGVDVKDGAQVVEQPIFDVSPETVRSWCGWRGAKCVGNLETGVHCDSLAKGKYAVVGVWVIFGHVSRPTVYFTGCKRDVTAFLARYGFLAGETLGHNGNGVYLVEVWHLVPTPVCVSCGTPIVDDKYIPVDCHDMSKGVICFGCDDVIGYWSDMAHVARQDALATVLRDLRNEDTHTRTLIAIGQLRAAAKAVN